MTNEIQKVTPENVLAQIQQSTFEPDRILQTFYSNKKSTTLAVYRDGMKRFTRFLGLSTEQESVRVLFALTSGQAHDLVLRFKDHLLNNLKLAPNTVNAALAAIRSLVSLGQMLGAVPWILRVRGAKQELRRDTRGPKPDVIRQIIQAVKQHPNPRRAARDAAILLLLYGRGLRASEVTEIGLGDFSAADRTVNVLRKGKREKIKLVISEEIVNAINAWLLLRGDQPGQLFTTLTENGIGFKRVRLWRIVHDAGKLAGISLHPHSLRHSAITEALNQSNGNIRRVAQFSGHANFDMLVRYDDERTDSGGAISDMLTAPPPPTP